MCVASTSQPLDCASGTATHSSTCAPPIFLWILPVFDTAYNSRDYAGMFHIGLLDGVFVRACTCVCVCVCACVRMRVRVFTSSLSW